MRRQSLATSGCKALTFSVLGFTVCMLLGMAQARQPAGDSGAFEPLIAEAFSNIESAYRQKNAAEFMVLLDADYGARLRFNESLQNHFLTFKELELHLFTDSLLSKGDKISVRLHWFKKASDNSGIFTTLQGSSRFVFRKYPEGLRLLYIRGDNPFF